MDFIKAMEKKSSVSTSSTSTSTQHDASERSFEEAQEQSLYESQIETVEEEEDIQDDEDIRDDQPIDYTKSKTPSAEISDNKTVYIEQKNDSKDSQHISINSCSEENIDSRIDDDSTGKDISTEKSPQIGTNNVERRLPKFKITRVISKRILTKDSESSRPLRKRKRIIVEANNNDDGTEAGDEENSQ
jgi:hypothetical protein